MKGSLTLRGHRRAALGTLLLAVVAWCAMTGSALAKKVPHVNIVSQSPPPENIPANTNYYSTIQEAVNATRNKFGDWVLIEPGVYKEEVVVTKTHSDIHIRGMDRNTVILDGSEIENPHGANGIYIDKANDVWVENLTAHDFHRASPDGPNGNDIWWTGGDGSGKQGAHGWWGKYLTAYDTSLLGGYGIFTNNETEGSWEKIYSSGFNDSGIYIGACWECQAHVKEATIEKNAVGYSGSNSGGTLVIEKSVFRGNSAGIVPNGENPGDGPPPNDGECNRTKPHGPYVTISSTNIARCEVFKENLVTENNSLETPANESTAPAPWGVGVELPGDAAELVEDNTITKNVNDGVLGFEYPNPYPPVNHCSAQQKSEGCVKSIYFQLTGNKIANNTFEENGTSGKAYAGDIMLQGGIFPHDGHESVNNCVSGNSLSAATFPANIETTWGCQNTTTPPPENGPSGLFYVEELSGESVFGRNPTPQPAPGPQETMPNPCEGVPTNPLCEVPAT
jgi:hypothetical protein